MAEEKECEHCSRTFSRPTGEKRIADLLWEQRRYCSPACGYAAKKLAAEAARPRKACAVCGEEFSAPANRLARLATCGSAECKKRYAREVVSRKVSERKLADYASGVLKPYRR